MNHKIISTSIKNKEKKISTTDKTKKWSVGVLDHGQKINLIILSNLKMYQTNQIIKKTYKSKLASLSSMLR